MLTLLLQKGWVRNYLNNLILWAPIFPELFTRLKPLFSLHTDNGVKLNLSKCTFGLKEVTFQGHRISAAGSKPDPKHIEAVVRMKAPATVKEVRWSVFRACADSIGKTPPLSPRLPPRSQTHPNQNYIQLDRGKATGFWTVKTYALWALPSLLKLR